MSLIRRLSTTVFARVDDSVRQIENHDAIITATLNETRRKVAQTKVRLNRVHSDGQKLRQRAMDLENSEKKWTQRASEQAALDEEIALNCIRHRRDCQQQLTVLKESIARHEGTERQLQADLGALEQRLQKIAQQRNLLRTRQSATEVNRCLQEIEGLGSIDIDDTFERWEQRILENEILCDLDSPADALEKQFLDTEEKADLQAELQALCSNKE